MIPQQSGSDGGHAIAIVGYNEIGFVIQNSWGSTWGSADYAILTYQDWLDNAMDCWVAQLGVVRQDHTSIAASSTLHTDKQIFPVYLMWENDLPATVVTHIADAMTGVPRPAGGGEGFWIVHTHSIAALAGKLKSELVSLLAPAVRCDTFDTLVKPRLSDGTINRYQQFHLMQKAEEDDPTCGPDKRSLLHLVAESFEGAKSTPILGMQKYFDPAMARFENVTVHVSPGKTSPCTTHGGFDNDEPTQKSVLRFIKQ